MSTELLTTTFGSDSYESIAAATGVANTGSALLPNLKINREGENEQKQRLPMGAYAVVHNGITAFGTKTKFRLFLNTYQYMVWDDVAKNFTNKSIIIKNFNEQAIDELGGLKCGKISSNELKELSEKGLVSDEDKKIQKAIKCYRGMYGLVTFEDAVNEAGEAVVIENLPVLWRVAGVNFNAPKDALNAITKMRHLCFQHWLKLETKRDKQGSNVYYHSLVSADIANTVEFTSEDMATFGEFSGIIERENKYVADKWAQSKRHDVSAVATLDILAELDLNDPVDDIN